MKCSKCGAQIVAGATFCHQCGSAVAAALSNAPAKSPAKVARAGAGMIRTDSDEPEEILWQGAYSGRAMIGLWFAAGLSTVILLASAMAGQISGESWLRVLAGLAAMWVALVAWLFYKQLSIHYYLTGQRFIHERGLLWRTIDRIETIDLDDIVCQQGPVQRMLGVGTVRLKSSDQTTPEFVIDGIADVRNVASLIDEARRKERRKRGMYVEAV